MAAPSLFIISNKWPNNIFYLYFNCILLQSMVIQGKNWRPSNDALLSDIRNQLLMNFCTRDCNQVTLVNPQNKGYNVNNFVTQHFFIVSLAVFRKKMFLNLLSRNYYFQSSKFFIKLWKYFTRIVDKYNVHLDKCGNYLTCFIALGIKSFLASKNFFKFL